MRGRKPIPTHLKLVTAKRGRGVNRREPKPLPLLPEPPPELSPEALEEWHRIAPRLLAAGLLTMLDRSALAAYCQAYGRWVTAERVLAALAVDDPNQGLLIINPQSGAQRQHPLVGIAAAAMSDVVRFGAEFGMSPSARTRIIAGDHTPPDDPCGRVDGNLADLSRMVHLATGKEAVLGTTPTSAHPATRPSGW